MKANGIKPLIGCEVTLHCARSERSGAARPGEKTNFHLVLLAKNMEVITPDQTNVEAYTEGFYYKHV